MSEPTVIKTNEVTRSACPGHNDTLTVTNGVYEGLQFRYDTIGVDPVRGIQFNYSVLNGTLDEKDDFEQAISRLLAELLHEQMESNNLFYNGGVEATPEEMLKYMEENYGVTPDAPAPVIEIPGEPQKNLAQQIMQAPGVFTAKKEESAKTFLERLAAQGMAAMGKQ